jgi:hypothetical protein
LIYGVALLVDTAVLSAALIWKPDDEGERRPFYPGQVLVLLSAALLMGVLYRDAGWVDYQLYTSRRNFYGVLRVAQNPEGKILIHGTTLHGAQLNPPYDRYVLWAAEWDRHTSDKGSGDPVDEWASADGAGGIGSRLVGGLWQAGRLLPLLRN